MRFKVSACIRISNWFWIKLEQNHGFGMQVCVYAPGPMSWFVITANSCINSVLSILSKIGSRARKFIMPFLQEFFLFLLNVKSQPCAKFCGLMPTACFSPSHIETWLARYHLALLLSVWGANSRVAISKWYYSYYGDIAYLNTKVPSLRGWF